MKFYRDVIYFRVAFWQTFYFNCEHGMKGNILECKLLLSVPSIWIFFFPLWPLNVCQKHLRIQISDFFLYCNFFSIHLQKKIVMYGHCNILEWETHLKIKDILAWIISGNCCSAAQTHTHTHKSNSKTSSKTEAIKKNKLYDKLWPRA